MQKQALMAIFILVGSSFVYADTTPSSTTATPTPQITPDTKAPPTTPETAAPAPAQTTGTDTNSDAASDMSKKTWLDTIIPMLPSLICKGFMGDPDLKQRLDAIKMNYDQCVSVLPESVSKCQNQLYSSIPEKITNADAATWGKTLGECIGKDFAMKHLLPK
jgi:hypothetical protein